MAESLITKRLLISGLTPAITKDDITGLLGSFGSVKAADGFGLADALGQPRKFAFVTLETTRSKLGKCMNVLSGSVWRGAKLRLGEARLDYKERIMRENQKSAEEPPKKRRRRCRAAHAEDMTLVTPANVSERPGWNVSPLGRITHPVVMIPDRPLPPGGKKPKRKHNKPITRSTRTVIDMPEWGSTYLKGIYLDSDVVLAGDHTPDSDSFAVIHGGDADSMSGLDEPIGKILDKLSQGSPTSHTSLSQLADANERWPIDEALLLAEPKTHASYEALDTQREKDQALDLLASLFSKDDDDWCASESIGSDIDTELAKDIRDLEVTDYEAAELSPITQENSTRRDDALVNKETVAASSTQEQVVPMPATSMTNNKATLKDLFAPQEDVGFSLLDHLELDVDMNEDATFFTEQARTAEPVINEKAVSASRVIPKTGRQPPKPRVFLDSKQALFFPVLGETESGGKKALQRDPYEVARENGWCWSHPAVGFWKWESEEQITKLWEESRGELTKQWKSKRREAGKARNRKRSDGDEIQQRLDSRRMD